MADFKEFLFSKKNKPQSLGLNSSSTGLALKISSTLDSASLSISNTEREKFGSEVAQLAYSHEVLSDLSHQIGKPKHNESEDEFVERAKSALASILKSKILK